MHALAQAIEDHAEEIAQIESLDNGKPVGLAQYVDVRRRRRAPALLRRLADARSRAACCPWRRPNMHCYTRREPVGVCAQIIPWNFPLLMAAWKLGAGARGGLHDRAQARRADAAERAARSASSRSRSGFPPGVLNVLTGDGSTGAALVDHPGVDKIAFTGSTAVGREIGAKAGRGAEARHARARRQVAEHHPARRRHRGRRQGLLPGDLLQLRAGLQRRLAAVRAGRALRRGHERRSPTAASSAQLGPGPRPGTQLGPLVSAEQQRPRDGLHRRPAARRAPSCSPAARRALTDSGGYFVAPTLFATTSDELRIAREEIFGPVLVASPYDTLEEVAERANDERVRPGRGRVDA